MSVDYFAHAVYGIEPDEDDLARIAAIASADEDEEDVRAKPGFAALVRVLRAKYGAPREASLHYTGDEDDRPGRCATPAGTWVFGVGMCQMPVPVSSGFAAKATWHSWVEVG